MFNQSVHPNGYNLFVTSYTHVFGYIQDFEVHMVYKSLSNQYNFLLIDNAKGFKVLPNPNFP